MLYFPDLAGAAAGCGNKKKYWCSMAGKNLVMARASLSKDSGKFGEKRREARRRTSGLDDRNGVVRKNGRDGTERKKMVF